MSLYIVCSKPFRLHIFSMISINSLVGILVYILETSNDTNFNSLSNGISLRSFIKCTEFFTLKICVSGMWVSSVFTSCFASLHAGASVRFMTGLMAASCLCILTKPLMLGGNGFKFTYFHLLSLCIKLQHSFITFRSSRWNFVGRSFVVQIKLLFLTKYEIFSSYASLDMITMELPLSAFVITAFLSARKQWPISEQDYMRYRVTDNINKLYR